MANNYRFSVTKEETIEETCARFELMPKEKFMEMVIHTLFSYSSSGSEPFFSDGSRTPVGKNAEAYARVLSNREARNISGEYAGAVEEAQKRQLEKHAQELGSLESTSQIVKGSTEFMVNLQNPSDRIRITDEFGDRIWINGSDLIGLFSTLIVETSVQRAALNASQECRERMVQMTDLQITGLVK